MANTDKELISNLTYALQAARQTLEDVLVMRRPDLLSQLDGKTVSPNPAMERIAKALNIDFYLCQTINDIRAAQSLSEQESNAEGRVLLTTTLQRWDLRELTAEKQAGQPKYTLSVTQNTDQLLVKLLPENQADDEEQRINSLEATFEINNNLPCIHVHGGHDNLALSVYGNAQGGVNLRQGDTESIAVMVDNSIEGPAFEVVEESQPTSGERPTA